MLTPRPTSRGSPIQFYWSSAGIGAPAPADANGDAVTAAADGIGDAAPTALSLGRLIMSRPPTAERA